LKVVDDVIDLRKAVNATNAVLCSFNAKQVADASERNTRKQIVSQPPRLVSRAHCAGGKIAFHLLTFDRPAADTFVESVSNWAGEFRDCRLL
jgi:hypothetical protein